MRTTIHTAASLAALLLWMGGCGGEDAADQKLAQGIWEAQLTVPGGKLDFGMWIHGADEAPSVALINGEERVPVDYVSVDGSRYTFRFPAFNSTIQATLEGAGSEAVLEGTLTLIKRGGVEQVIPFRAHPLITLVKLSPPLVDVSGTWRVEFVDDEGDAYPAIGEFMQEGSNVGGTFLTPTGDYRYLVGRVWGREFTLSCFDGSHAFLFTARVAQDGTMVGDFWSGTRWHESWTAVRDSAASLPDPDSLTKLREGARFTFDFPDVHGNRVSGEDERFRGKVVLVTLAGSWCPNCADETVFLTRLYRTHYAAGLEAVGLMYEHYRDFERAATQVERFAEKHDVPYPLLVAGFSDKREAAATLPALESVVAFPTIIAIDRKGEVRRIYTGFTGPGTGAHYNEFRQEFTAFVEGLLDESM